MANYNELCTEIKNLKKTISNEKLAVRADQLAMEKYSPERKYSFSRIARITRDSTSMKVWLKTLNVTFSTDEATGAVKVQTLTDETDADATYALSVPGSSCTTISSYENLGLVDKDGKSSANGTYYGTRLELTDDITLPDKSSGKQCLLLWPKGPTGDPTWPVDENGNPTSPDGVKITTIGDNRINIHAMTVGMNQGEFGVNANASLVSIGVVGASYQFILSSWAFRIYGLALKGISTSVVLSAQVYSSVANCVAGSIFTALLGIVANLAMKIPLKGSKNKG